MKFQTKEMTMLALMTAFCVVGRLLSSIVPNAQPVTATLLLLTLYVGWQEAVIVSSLSMLITNFYLGMGIWTVVQILSFACVIVIVHFSTRIWRVNQHLLRQLMLCVIASMGYGLLVSWMLAPFWGAPRFWPYYLAGISFDVSHSISTVMFFMLLKQPFLKVFAQKQLLNGKI